MNSPLVNQKLAIIDRMDFLRSRLETLERKRFSTSAEETAIFCIEEELDDLRQKYDELKKQG